MNDLIYGKNNTQGITSIEVKDDKAFIYIEGQKDPLIEKNRFWILCNQPLNKRFQRLDGDLHYKYGIEFDNRDEFSKMRWYWKDEDIYSVYNETEAFMMLYGHTSFKGLKHTDVSVLSWDIETTGLKYNKDSKIIMISNTFRNKNGTIRKLFCYDEYKNDAEMFIEWCNWVREVDPSIMLGHNVYGYDLPYMQYCADRCGVELNLGKDGSELWFDKKESKFRKDATQFLHYKKPHVHGRELIDTMFLAITYDFGRKYISYGLKQIISQEGLEVKDRVFYDASKIRENYLIPEEMIKIKAYAEFDADDSLALYDLMIPAFFYAAQSIPKSFESISQSATGSQINSILVRSYLQEGHSIPKSSEGKPFAGATSFAIPGIYKNLWKVDIKSAYPSCILIYKIFDKNKDPKGNFLEMVKFFTNERYEYKKKFKQTNDIYYKDRDASAKIFINSCYGLLGSQGLNFNNHELAAQITKATRDYLNTAILWASGKDTKFWLEKLEKKNGN